MDNGTTASQHTLVEHYYVCKVLQACSGVPQIYTGANGEYAMVLYLVTWREMDKCQNTTITIPTATTALLLRAESLASHTGRARGGGRRHKGVV